MKESKYIEFIQREIKAKTFVYEIVSKSSGCGLGLIKWYGAWRQYSFFPYEETIFNHQCLDDILEFIVAKNECHKTRLKNESRNSCRNKK